MKIAILILAATEVMMNEYVATEVFSQAEKLCKNACVLGSVQSVMMQESVATYREFYSRTAAAALDGAKAMTELADAVWSSTKVLNDKIMQNATANAEAAFDAAQTLAGATSFAEVATIQREFVQQLFARTAAQSREFFDLAARAAEHVIETAHTAASRSLKAGS